MRTLVASVFVLSACGRASTVPAVPVGVAEPALPFTCGDAGRWAALPETQLAGRVDHSAVWTGDTMILWGGTQRARRPFSDGARYTGGTWQLTAAAYAPVERDDHAAVWTGREMIVWGGNSYREDRDKLDDGGRYDPTLDAWRPLPSFGLTARDDPRAVWTGRELLVWGGRDAAGHTDDGVRYDPATDRVRPISRTNAPAPREDHTALWTGREMIIWGGWNGADHARNYALSAAAYDPATDTWRTLSTAGAPEPREDHTAAWTGTEMLVWGGAVRDPSSPPAPRSPRMRRAPVTEAAERAESASDDSASASASADDSAPTLPLSTDGPRQLSTGGRYDPLTDRWTPITNTDAPDAREDDVVVWTGTEMLVWGGQRAGRALPTGARYTPSADAWCPLPTDGAPSARFDHAGVWTGDALVVWGGMGTSHDYLATGATFVR